MKYSKEWNGKRVHFRFVSGLIAETGWNDEIEDEKLAKLMIAMKVYVDREGFVYYHDLLYGLIKRKYEKTLIEKQEKFINKIIFKEEAIFYKKLEEIRNSFSIRKNDPGHQSSEFLFDFYMQKNVFCAWKNHFFRKKLKNSKIKFKH